MGQHGIILCMESTPVQTYHSRSTVGVLYISSRQVRINALETGSSVLLYGTIAQDNLNGVVPTWNCFLDGVGINSNVTQAGNTPISTNNWELCANDVAVDDGSHTVTLQTTVIAANQTFWFDYIKYAPVLDASWENENIYVDDKDSEIRYVGIWDSTSGHSGVEHATNETGADVDFSFIGRIIADNSIYLRALKIHSIRNIYYMVRCDYTTC
jgi:hypothetical protein